MFVAWVPIDAAANHDLRGVNGYTTELYDARRHHELELSPQFLHDVVLLYRVDDVVVLQASKHIDVVVVLSSTSPMIGPRTPHVLDRSPGIHLHRVSFYAVDATKGLLAAFAMAEASNHIEGAIHIDTAMPVSFVSHILQLQQQGWGIRSIYPVTSIRRISSGCVNTSSHYHHVRIIPAIHVDVVLNAAYAGIPQSALVLRLRVVLNGCPKVLANVILQEEGDVSITVYELVFVHYMEFNIIIYLLYWNS